MPAYGSRDCLCATCTLHRNHNKKSFDLKEYCKKFPLTSLDKTCDNYNNFCGNAPIKIRIWNKINSKQWGVTEHLRMLLHVVDYSTLKNYRNTDFATNFQPITIAHAFIAYRLCVFLDEKIAADLDYTNDDMRITVDHACHFKTNFVKKYGNILIAQDILIVANFQRRIRKFVILNMNYNNLCMN
jgi:hypothetical protein